jgi:hypothetical protein
MKSEHKKSAKQNKANYLLFIITGLILLAGAGVFASTLSPNQNNNSTTTKPENTSDQNTETVPAESTADPQVGLPTPDATSESDGENHPDYEEPPATETPAQ